MDNSSPETRELLIGTWIVVAVIVERLIERDILSREELLSLLAEAQAAAPDRRATTFAGLRLLIERGLAE
jgi:hypothetical protein